MRAPIIYEDYKTDIENNGLRKRKVLVSIVDDTYLRDKKHKPTNIRSNTVVCGCEFELDDTQRFEEVLTFIKTILHDQMAEEAIKFKKRVSNSFSEDKKIKFKEKIDEASNRSYNARQHLKRMKEEGAKYLIVEDIENNILIRCDEIND
jgi:hypothetical protein